MFFLYFTVFKNHQKLLKSLDITLIILALLQLAVNIRYAIWGIRALCPQGDKDVEEQLPQIMEEIILIHPRNENWPREHMNAWAAHLLLFLWTPAESIDNNPAQYLSVNPHLLVDDFFDAWI